MLMSLWHWTNLKILHYSKYKALYWSCVAWNDSWGLTVLRYKLELISILEVKYLRRRQNLFAFLHGTRNFTLAILAISTSWGSSFWLTTLKLSYKQLVAPWFDWTRTQERKNEVLDLTWMTTVVFSNHVYPSQRRFRCKSTTLYSPGALCKRCIRPTQGPH